VNAVRDLAVPARLLNPWTEAGVSQRDAALVAARGIDNLPGRDGTVGVNPVAPSPTVGGGGVGDLLAVALQLCGRKFSHCDPAAKQHQPSQALEFSLAGDCINLGALKKPFGAIRVPGGVQVGSAFHRSKTAFVTSPATVCGSRCQRLILIWYSHPMSSPVQSDERFKIIADMIQKAREKAKGSDDGYRSLIEAVQALADEVRELAKNPSTRRQ
jgi:hypothetical protein